MTQIDWQAVAQCEQAMQAQGLDIRLLKDDEPVFAQPWQAQAFAVMLALHDRGFFTWPQWAQTLSECIKSAQENGDSDLGTTYYHHWLAAIEKLSEQSGLVSEQELQSRQVAWRVAAARTPHGKPIELSNQET